MAGWRLLRATNRPRLELSGTAGGGGRGWLHRAWWQGVGVCLFMVVVSFSFFLVSSPYRSGITLLTSQPRPARDPKETFSDLRGFLVHSPSCSIPDLDPFHHTVKHFIVPPKPVTCGLPAFTSSRGSTLHLHRDILHHHFHILQQFYWNTTTYRSSPSQPSLSLSPTTTKVRPMRDAEAVKCCYRGMERVQQTRKNADASADGLWRYTSKCLPFNTSRTEVQEDAALIVCTIENVVVYKNVHYFFRKRNNESPSAPSFTENLKRVEGAEKLSVIFIGTDSVSRLNLLRQMPETYKYLTNKLGALDLQGLNKVGESTFPNIVAHLGGLTHQEVKAHPCMTKSLHYDDCPWVWKDFKRNGYVTAYMEDAPWIGTFHYMRRGFIAKPTDYYGRPFTIASEKEIGKKMNDLRVCQGPELSVKVVQDYSLEFERTFLDTPSFGFFWSASLSHDQFNMVHLADESYVNYLKELEEMGALNNTVIFFISDHGMRWGNLRSTYIGMLEDRLPYCVLYLPPWFRKKYHQAYDNLVVNTNRLIANFDIHETLLDLAYGRFADLEYLTSEPSKTKRGISLFRSVPWDRSCADAGIPQHFCVCQNTREVAEDDQKLGPAVDFLKDSLNYQLLPYTQCEQFTTVTVISARVSRTGKELKSEELKSEVQTYLIQVLLTPGDVAVEASLRHSQQDNSFTLLGSISRINKYGWTSGCVQDSILRTYCYCRDQVKAQQLYLERIKMKGEAEETGSGSKRRRRRSGASGSRDGWRMERVRKKR